MRTLAHVSDLHFGSEIPEAVRGLQESLLEIRPDLVVVSGDLTQRATVRQFREARKFLNRLPSPCIAIPGNHDVSLYNLYRRFLLPIDRFKTYIGEELAPFYEDQEIAVLGINTARSLTFKNGRISLAQMELIRSRFCPLAGRKFKVLATHHPLLPPPGRRSESVVGRAQKMLVQVDGCSPDLALAGHFHMSYSGATHSVYTVQEGSTLVVQAGTAISKRTRGEKNAYNLINIDDGLVDLSVLMWDGRSFTLHRTERFKRIDHGTWAAVVP